MTALDRRGPTDAPVVVLVHGAGISRKMWLPQTESLSEDFQTVAPDLPGHGDRADEPFRFEVAVETIEATRDEGLRGDSNCLLPRRRETVT